MNAALIAEFYSLRRRGDPDQETTVKIFRDYTVVVWYGGGWKGFEMRAEGLKLQTCRSLDGNVLVAFKYTGEYGSKLNLKKLSEAIDPDENPFIVEDYRQSSKDYQIVERDLGDFFDERYEPIRFPNDTGNPDHVPGLENWREVTRAFMDDFGWQHSAEKIARRMNQILPAGCFVYKAEVSAVKREGRVAK